MNITLKVIIYYQIIDTISGCLRNQGKCWGNNKSPPLNGSREGRLECRSDNNNNLIPKVND